jgi:hypothetical protein
MDRLEKIAKIAKHLRVSPHNQDGLTRLGRETDQMSLIMDIECVDKEYNLDLDFMLADLDSFDVAHDVIGIYRNLDRKTKKLTGQWLPRFARDWEEIQDAQLWELDKSLD